MVVTMGLAQGLKIITPMTLPVRHRYPISALVALVLLAASATWAADPLLQVPTVLHAHSTWSTGDQSLEQLIARARAIGIQAVFLTENHLLRFEYGLPPLRHLLRYRVEYPSVLQKGPEAFLMAVAAANAHQNDVLLIPGTEVTPYYYWTGSLLGGTLTMYDAQKNILILGLYRPEDYREIPVAGNPGATRWSWQSVWLLSPVLLGVPGVWLLRTRRRRVVRLQHFRVTEERRLIGPGVLCLLLGGIILANNFPFRRAPVSPYDPTAGLRPHQAVIDFVSSRGGLTVWSMPEAKDHQVVTVAGLRATIHTDPYPSDLLHTDRFTAFGGVYEETTTFTQPGGGWDRLLADYVGGRRAAPAWAIGEAAYHREGQAGKRFGEVQTVLLAERKDPAALLQALRAGRAYALRRTVEQGLILDQFQVSAWGRPPAEAGGRLILQAADRPEVLAAVRGTGPRPLKVEVRLVRSGTLVHSVQGETPLALRWTDPMPPTASGLYYRLEINAPGGHQILSNPIFVQSAGG